MQRQSGNVLFLILIAVALFAVLSYAVTSSTRSGGGSITKEKAKSNAAAIIEYGASLRSAIMRMKVSNGCTNTNLDFSNTIYKKNTGTAMNSANSTAPADKKCHLFAAEGGNLPAIVPPITALDAANPLLLISGETNMGAAAIRVRQMKGIGTDGPAGTESANDIIFGYDFLNKETCMAINDILGIDNPADEPLNAPFTTGSVSGAYINGSWAGDWVMDNPSVNGQFAFCANTRASDHNYAFIQILIEQ